MTLYVGLSTWILSDGNYDEFNAGQETKFALEFYGPKLAPAIDAGTPKLEYKKRSDYIARGEVVYVSSEVWVCDFGVLAYREEQPPEWAQPGERLGGPIYIGIDPFPYFESLHCLPACPS